MKRPSPRFVLVGLAATLLLTAAACSSGAKTTTADAQKSTTSVPATAPVGKTIVELAAGNPELSTLVAAVKAAGLADTLAGTGPYTVFAPTNAAFAALPAGTVENLLKPENKDQLVKVLTYHVVPGAVTSTQLMNGPVTTVEKQPVTIKIDGKTVMVNDATVVTADVMASNGVVHVIDKVLLPPTN
ncbi:MAG TPA: fasciclin domain-containing protein [Acidimicrobiales bacterium]